MKRILSRVDVYTSDITLTDQTFSGWKAINTGNTSVNVLGVEIPAGGELDMTHISSPDVLWTSNIPIKVNSGEVTLIRLVYKEMEV